MGWLRLPLLLSLLLLAGPGRAQTVEWADWLVGTRLDTRLDSNVNRADAGSEQEWDVSAHPSLELGRVLQLGERTRLSLSAGVGGELFARAEDLARVEVDGRVALVHKLGLGDAPWLRVYARGGHGESRDHERSGAIFAAGAVVGRRLSPRLDARLGYEFSRRYGGRGEEVVAGISTDVFDQSAHRIALDAGYLLTPDLLLIAGASYRRGDFDSNAQGSRFEVLADSDVDAVARDDVFGGWVYRVEGDAWSPYLRLNQALADRWSVDLGYRFQYADGEGLRYRNHGVTAAVLFRY